MNPENKSHRSCGTPAGISAEGAPQFVGPVEVNDLVTLQSIFRFRERIWTQERVQLKAGLCSPEGITDEHDSHAIHWVVTLSGEIVAAARLCIHERLCELPDADGSLRLDDDIPLPAASMNRLVVASAARGHGLARALDEIRIKRAREAGAASVVGIPQRPRVAPLKKFGFRTAGCEKNPIWGDEELPVMVLDLRG